MRIVEIVEQAIRDLVSGLPDGCVKVERRHFDIRDAWTEFQLRPSREGASRIDVSVDDDETVVGIHAGVLVNFEVYVGRKHGADVSAAIEIVFAIVAGGLVEEVSEVRGKAYKSSARLTFPDGQVSKSWTHGAEYGLYRPGKIRRRIEWLPWRGDAN